jgi:hypothetical protein
LRNRIVIEVHTASFRSTRGYSIVCALLDEIAYWPTDEASSEPDVEIINAIKPGQATIPGAMLLCASSPHARKGALWSAFARHYGKDGDPILVWRAPTRAMNATVPQSYVDAHMTEDAARASAEYMAEFRYAPRGAWGGGSYLVDVQRANVSCWHIPAAATAAKDGRSRLESGLRCAADHERVAPADVRVPRRTA